MRLYIYIYIYINAHTHKFELFMVNIRKGRKCQNNISIETPSYSIYFFFDYNMQVDREIMIALPELSSLHYE